MNPYNASALGIIFDGLENLMACQKYFLINSKCSESSLKHLSIGLQKDSVFIYRIEQYLSFFFNNLFLLNLLLLFILVIYAVYCVHSPKFE